MTRDELRACHHADPDRLDREAYATMVKWSLSNMVYLPAFFDTQPKSLYDIPIQPLADHHQRFKQLRFLPRGTLHSTIIAFHNAFT